MVDLLFEIHSALKKKYFHSNTMKHLYSGNNYYDINKYYHPETKELALEEIVELPKDELGDEARFLSHSYFDNKRNLFDKTLYNI